MRVWLAVQAHASKMAALQQAYDDMAHAQASDDQETAQTERENEHKQSALDVSL